MESLIKKVKPVIRAETLTGTTDATGNFVLSSDYSGRLIINIDTTFPLAVWSFGYVGNGVKMIHFTNHAGQNLVNSEMTITVYFMLPGIDYDNVAVT